MAAPLATRSVCRIIAEVPVLIDLATAEEYELLGLSLEARRARACGINATIVFCLGLRTVPIWEIDQLEYCGYDECQPSRVSVSKNTTIAVRIL